MPHQPTTTLHSNVTSEGNRPTNAEHNSYFRDPRLRPLPVTSRSDFRPNGSLKSESFSLPGSFSQISPPSQTPAPNQTPFDGVPTMTDDNPSVYSYTTSPPYPIEPKDCSTAAYPETIIDVLPSEITCPACILQVKHKRACSFQRSLPFI